MKPIRFTAALLSAVLALLSPGTEAWAALAKTGTAPSPGRVMPVGQVLAVPGRTAGAAAAAPLFDLRPSLLGAPAAPGIRLGQDAAGPLLPTALPAPAPATDLAATGPEAAPSRAVESPAISLSRKVGTIAEESTPHVLAAQADGSSPADLKEGGAEIQRILEGNVGRTAVPLEAGSGLPLAACSSHLRPADGKAGETHGATLPSPELSAVRKSQFRFYAAAVAGVKVGIEALNLAVPLLLLTQLQAATAVATLYLAAEVASIFAGLAGGALVDLIGAKRAMVLTGFAQAAAIAGVPLAIASGGTLALPMVYGLFVVNGVVSELFDVARRTALPQIVGHDEGLLRKHNGGVYVWREIAATAGVFGAGWLVHQIGAMATIWAHPAFCAAAALAALRLLRSGTKDHPVRAGPAQPRAGIGLKARFRAWLDDIKAGVRYVVSEKKLRTIVLVNIPLNALHKIFHTLLAVVFAAKVLNDPAMAAVMLGAWNLGELAGAFYLGRWGPRSSLSNWMRLAAAASLAVWTFFLLPTAWAGVAASFLLATAMIGNELGTASYMQSTVPERELGAVAGFVYGFARAVGMAGLLAAGWAFDTLGASGGFLAMGVIFTALAPIYLIASFRFKSQKLDPPANMPED